MDTAFQVDNNFHGSTDYDILDFVELTLKIEEQFGLVLEDTDADNVVFMTNLTPRKLVDYYVAKWENNK